MRRKVHKCKRKSLTDDVVTITISAVRVAPFKQIQQFSHYKCFSCQIIFTGQRPGEGIASLTAKLMNEKKKQIKEI